MRIVILGGTGFIGSALTQRLVARGDHVVIPTRRVFDPDQQANPELPLWDGQDATRLASLFHGADAVINLAGENIAARRWSDEQKKRIVESRVLMGQAVVNALNILQIRPRTLIQASALGYYGFWSEALPAPVCTEDMPPGASFLASTAVEWEHSTQTAESLGVRRCILRTAPVLGKSGGMLARLLPIFQMGLGGTVGTGRQPFPWIHLDDEVSAILFLLDHEDLDGAFNMVAPQQVTMREFVEALGKALHRPVRIPIPAFAIRLALGEMATELLLGGQKASPARLLEQHFDFRHPDLASALRF